MIREINFDGLVGPTHHYGGLGVGNLASHHHAGQVANPKAAALQGLDKMALMHSLGCLQAVLPPQPRPCISLLRACGFTGTNDQVVQAAAQHDRQLLSAAFSASSMWTANAATVTRGGLIDGESENQQTVFTPANLVSSLHRSLEPAFTTALLREVFSDPKHFAVHNALPSAYALRDEGAANHMRLSNPEGNVSWDVLVNGDSDVPADHETQFPARQTLATCRALARRHSLDSQRTIFLRQHPEAIAAGAFHNDVVATSFENVLLFHEKAFDGASKTLDLLAANYQRQTGLPFFAIRVDQADMSLEDAVSSYLFNSQIVRVHSKPNQPITIICPAQCQEIASAAKVLDSIVNDQANPISAAQFVELRQSMHNGGGPACLRLRVPCDQRQRKSIKPSVLWTTALETALRSWVNKHYRDALSLEDLTDPKLIDQVQHAMNELADILDLNCLRDSSAC